MKKFLVRDLDPAISPPRLRRILYRNGYVKQQEVVDAGMALLIWTASVLEKRAPVTGEQQELLLEMLGEKIGKAGLSICDHLVERKGSVPVWQLMLVDNTLAALTGDELYLDLRDGTFKIEPAQVPIEIVSYNLTAIFAMHFRRLEIARQKEAAAQTEV